MLDEERLQPEELPEVEEEMVLEAYVQLPSSTALEVAPRALVKVVDQVSYVS